MQGIPLNMQSYTENAKKRWNAFLRIKEIHAMRYTHYRGLAQVTNWVRLKFAAMNLKKFAKRK